MLVRWTADRWRVITKAACFLTSSLKVVRTCRLARVLTEEAVLLKTSIGGPVSTIWVTYRSRCRLVDRPLLAVETGALQFRGSCTTKRRVRVVPVVVTTLLLAVVG